ncbi:hypothetical protein CU254_03320 [Amycolatopsis sp. AA4]|uniref:hypothetical protein n=1 Tax=Actinomycetes TaxID=1760 RepID=UPI0001DEE16C|nr:MULTISPECIES: hypothetical protein [Actinomycetes]ATY09604.1 hypothetical protein CU254_03320 [Amycolatopsis sp. AA4]EFL04973.1 conserved hypothetical protein [Streptomyces sp. AA4]
MSARILSFFAVGAALLITSCSGESGGTASPSPSSAPASSAAAAVQPSSAPPSSSAAPTSSAVAESTGGDAVERYEAFMHAAGREDLATVCEIAGPAAKKAEAQGMGPCEKTMPMAFQLISPAQKKALQTATVDRSKIKEGAKKVEIPARAVKASVKFTDSDLGDAVMENRGGKWYVVD